MEDLCLHCSGSTALRLSVSPSRHSLYITKDTTPSYQLGLYSICLPLACPGWVNSLYLVFSTATLTNQEFLKIPGPRILLPTSYSIHVMARYRYAGSGLSPWVPLDITDNCNFSSNGISVPEIRNLRTALVALLHDIGCTSYLSSDFKKVVPLYE